MIYRFIVMFLTVATACNAASYVHKYTFEQLAGDLSPTFLYATVSDDNYVYSQFYGSGGRSSGITRIDSNGVSTVLVTPDQWQAISGKTTMSGIYNFSEYGDSLYLADTSSDQAYKIDKNTGSISVIASVLDILTVMDYEVFKINLISPGVADSSGFYFNDCESDHLFLAAPQGLSVAITRDQIVNMTGGTDLSGGMASDDAGNLYMCGNNGIYKWDTENVQGISLLSEGEIRGYTRSAGISIRDIYYAPDGNLYFYDNMYGILSLNLATDGSLVTVLTNSQLVDGPANSSNVYGLSWFEGNLAFTEMYSGYYVVPEPATMSILAIGALAVFRRKQAKR